MRLFAKALVGILLLCEASGGFHCGAAYAMGSGPQPHPGDFPYGNAGPYYSAFFGEGISSPKGKDSSRLKVVSYNLNFAEDLPGILRDLTQLRDTSGADFILLQEVDGPQGGVGNAAEVIARELGMNYVFAPGCVFRSRDYGNAILSRWPIRDFRKVLLPGSEEFTQRVALGVTAKIGERDIQVYTLHLSMLFGDSWNFEWSRHLQIEAALEQINENSALPAFLAGDFNNFNPIGWMLSLWTLGRSNFESMHPDDLGWTFRKWRFILDHLYARGFESISAGNVIEAQGSDHIPIWAELRLKSADQMEK